MWQHGTLYGYKMCKPRCEQCMKAESRYRDELRKKRLKELSPDDPRHGKSFTLVKLYRCPCAPCLTFASENQRRYRETKRKNIRLLNEKLGTTK